MRPLCCGSGAGVTGVSSGKSGVTVSPSKVAESSGAVSGRSGISGVSTCAGVTESMASGSSGVEGGSGAGSGAEAMACVIGKATVSTDDSPGRSGRSGVDVDVPGAGPTLPVKSSSLSVLTIGEYRFPSPVWTGSATSAIGSWASIWKSTGVVGASLVSSSTACGDSYSTVSERVGLPALMNPSESSSPASPN